MDISKAPKQFLDNVTGGFSEEFFVLAMVSGEHATAYALTPQHAKRLSQWLAYQIEDYEKKHKKNRSRVDSRHEKPHTINRSVT